MREKSRFPHLHLSPRILPGLVAVIARMALVEIPYFSISRIYQVITFIGGGFTTWPESVDMMQNSAPTALMTSPRALGGSGLATWGVQS